MKTRGLQISRGPRSGVVGMGQTRTRETPLNLAGKGACSETASSVESRGRHPICRCVYQSTLLSSTTEVDLQYYSRGLPYQIRRCKS